MTPTDFRWKELAEEARVKPPHIFMMWHWLSAGAPVEHFAKFAGLEARHVEAMMAALSGADMLPVPRRRRAGPTTASAGSHQQARSTRLPPAMQLPDEWLSFAQTTRRWSKESVELEFQTFLDYWHAQPGQKGVKLDWLATWRNWVRRSHTPDGIFVPNAAPQDRDEGVWLYQERKRLDSAPYDAEAEAEWARRRDAAYGLRAG